MTSAAQVHARLDELEDELTAALGLLAGAVPAHWRSPAARAYQERLDDLGDLIRHQRLVCRQARSEVGYALTQVVPVDPLFPAWAW